MPDGRSWNEASEEEVRAAVLAAIRFRAQMNRALEEAWDKSEREARTDPREVT